MTALPSLLSRKLKKVLETRTDSPDLLASLQALSTFYTENTLQTRRNLRATLERRGLAINEEFLAASESAQQALDAVEAEVQGLADCCDRVAHALSSCSGSTGNMVVATERLKGELENTLRRQELVSAFLHNYQLTPEEIAALREEELDERFFRALARVQEIHSNCKVLLRTHHQRAGLELMDVMAVYQEGAYERLCRWVQAECRSLGHTDTPEVSDLLKTAARSLKERPVLFKYCAEEVANTRHNALFRRFISALTRGGPGGMPRPIEVHAHDPLRYVGDMLAWLHQALASERELATALFSSQVGREDGGGSSSRRFLRTADGGEVPAETRNGGGAVGAEAEDMAAVLDRVFEGVCRPFRLRVEQVLAAPPGVLLAYNLANLLAFYSHTIADLLGGEAALSMTLEEVREAAQRTFFDIVKARGDKLLRFPPLVASDLSPPPAVPETMAVVQELLEAHKRIMVASAMAKPDFEPVLEATLNPLLEMCQRAAQSYGSSSGSKSGSGGVGGRSSSMRGSDSGSSSGRASNGGSLASPAQGGALESLRTLFLVNCYAAIQQPLLPHEAAQGKATQLGEAIEGHIRSLVQAEALGVLDRCGLSTKVVAMAEADPSGPPLATCAGLSPAAVSDSLRALFALLAGSLEGESLPEFEPLQVPRLREEARNRVASALAEAYQTVYRAVLDPRNLYPEPRLMLRHTPEQMCTILGI
eukprot:TRINITY_DN29826_c0_g1_i1.p1 TRINITY_DN29826_c0_g1~~TRINITY_DN29826_c0_g1_i1.p1  ORF type:complete len:707 (+),score=155.94 TRINITY_DN29826_c0_g1_i1:799-2919(+)